MLKPVSHKKCKDCGDEFKPFNTIQSRCVQCSIVHGKGLQRKEFKEKKKAARRAKKEFYDNDPKTIKAKLTKACHLYIRTRDKDEPCISCGRYDPEIKEALTGGKWDAGHYKSKGAFPEQRYNEYNIHKQCKSCNGGACKFAKKAHTVQQSYKVNLIEKIGLRHVEWLEGHHEPQKLTIDDLKEIEAYYKEQLRILKCK